MLLSGGATGRVEIDRLIREGDPPQEIVIAADRWRADLVVVGSHSHGRLARLLLSSTAEAVAAAGQPVAAEA